MTVVKNSVLQTELEATKAALEAEQKIREALRAHEGQLEVEDMFLKDELIDERERNQRLLEK